MRPIASPRTELGPDGRPAPRSRAGQTSRGRGNALTRIPDPAWALMWEHAERVNRRDGLVALVVFQVPLRQACRISRDRDGRLRSDHPPTQRRLRCLDPDMRARVNAWLTAEPQPSVTALETWFARGLTTAVRTRLRADGALWADYLSLSVLRVRARGLEFIWEFRKRPVVIRAITGSPQLIDRRQFLQPTADGINRLAQAAEELARPLAALLDEPAVRAALDRLDSANDPPLDRTAKHPRRRR
ncbi:MAG TPA: hypothetical protein VGX28_12285 [Frankiaceae bacterium]|jgi:hypothetical protein|nr:hypothetical protein [Frankiaceae bacterium]